MLGIVRLLRELALHNIHNIKEGNRAFVVMELIRGLSLEKVINTISAEANQTSPTGNTTCPLSLSVSLPSGMTNSETLKVTTEILDALSLLHDLNYAHRDIKLDNIMFQDDGKVMVGGRVPKLKTNNFENSITHHTNNTRRHPLASRSSTRVSVNQWVLPPPRRAQCFIWRRRC